MTAANDILRPAHIGESVEGPEGYMDDSFTSFDYTLDPGSGSALLDEVSVWKHEGLFSMSESYPVHDAYGNVCEIRRADAPVVALLWGYNSPLRSISINGHPARGGESITQRKQYIFKGTAVKVLKRLHTHAQPGNDFLI